MNTERSDLDKQETLRLFYEAVCRVNRDMTIDEVDAMAAAIFTVPKELLTPATFPECVENLEHVPDEAWDLLVTSTELLKQ